MTAGGTREPIDPVRFVGNRSSGKMGHAVALAAARRGARVTLITASPLDAAPSVEVVRVETAQDMALAAWGVAPTLDVAILAAAVADFRPAGRFRHQAGSCGWAPGTCAQGHAERSAGPD